MDGFDWKSFVIGILLTTIWDRVALRFLAKQWSEHIRRKRERELESGFDRLRGLFPEYEVSQAGFLNGIFPPGSISVELGNSFDPPEPVRTLRTKHEKSWTQSQHFNGINIGLQSFHSQRLSDEPGAERQGLGHHLYLRAHRYEFFDFLSSHNLLVSGSTEERAILGRISADCTQKNPSHAFPTPCSVGLSLLCESGQTLVLVRRSRNASAAGYWQAGKVFNAVGENMAERDFGELGSPANISTPWITAARGLSEECGLSLADCDNGGVQLHSFVWDRPLLDYKFFGWVQTPLPRHLVAARWERAPDRPHESEETEPIFEPITSRSACLELVRRIWTNREDWSPEAAYCTVWTLISLNRISVDDVADVFGKS